MAHPLATKAIGAGRVKNDAIDARTLGQAHDASVRIEEFGAAATTAQERDLAARLAADNEALRDQPASIDATLKGIRSDASGSGKSTTRYNRAFLVLGCSGWLVAVISVVAVLIAYKVIG